MEKHMTQKEIIEVIEKLAVQVSEESMQQEAIKAIEAVRELIDEKEFVAVKLWDIEDIRGMLVEGNYCDTEENLALVMKMKHRMKKALEACTEEDWHIIENIIDEADTEYHLER